MPNNNAHRIHNNDTYIHIYNKGIADKNIFSDKQDYDVFVNYLKEYLTPSSENGNIKQSFTVRGVTFQGKPHLPKNYHGQIDLVAFSLMPNHFHLLLYQKNVGSVEKFIRSLCTRYAIYFNKKYKLTGSLFEGSYKSVSIKDMQSLLYLTHHFHNGAGSEGGRLGYHSSYPNYIGSVSNSWVKPDAVLSYLDKSDFVNFKGKNGYQNFVENHTLDNKEKSILERIIIETRPEALERSTNSTENKNIDQSKQVEAGSGLRIPELAVATGVFALLFGLGLNNIRASAIKGSIAINPLLYSFATPVNVNSQTLSDISPTPYVLGKEDTKLEETVIPSIEQGNVSVTPTLTPTAEVTVGKDVEPEEVATQTEGVTPVETLTIKITDGSKSVNVRQKPTIYSEKIMEVLDGQVFEYVSQKSGWYEIILENGTTGFVSAKYVEMVKSTIDL